MLRGGLLRTRRDEIELRHGARGDALLIFVDQRAREIHGLPTGIDRIDGEDQIPVRVPDAAQRIRDGGFQLQIGDRSIRLADEQLLANRVGVESAENWLCVLKRDRRIECRIVIVEDAVGADAIVVPRRARGASAPRDVFGQRRIERRRVGLDVGAAVQQRDRDARLVQIAEQSVERGQVRGFGARDLQIRRRHVHFLDRDVEVVRERELGRLRERQPALAWSGALLRVRRRRADERDERARPKKVKPLGNHDRPRLLRREMAAMPPSVKSVMWSARVPLAPGVQFSAPLRRSAIGLGSAIVRLWACRL